MKTKNDKMKSVATCGLSLTMLLTAVLMLTSCRYRVHGRDRMTDADAKSEAHSEVSYQQSEEQHDAATTVTTDGLEIPEMKSSKGQLLQRTGYTTQYNSGTRCPDWTAWHLTAGHTNGSVKRKSADYQEDFQVREPRATRDDYFQAPYDRGHMCPAGDNKWSPQAMQDCFLYTNMCPQNHNMNGGVWNDLEMKCRTWAKQFGDIYIVCGPTYDSAAPAKFIGKNKVRVPDGFFKAVLCTRGTPKAIGFYYPNTHGEGSIEDHAMPVRQLERMTGIDFFPRLDRDIQDKIETSFNYADWQ